MLSLSLYHWTDKLSSRKLFNRAFHLPNVENSPITEKEHSYGGEKKKKKRFLRENHLWNGSGQGENHTAKEPADHPGSNSSFNKDDCKLLSVAERWQGFLRDAAEHGKRGRGACVLIWGEQRDGYLCQKKQLRREESASESRLESRCHVVFSHVLGSLALAFLFSSALPTSVLTFKEECGPGYRVPHQWRRRRADVPCVTLWHASLVTSCLCWCQLAVSAGRLSRSVKLFLCHRHPLPNMHWGWVSPLHVPLLSSYLWGCTRSTHRIMLEVRVSSFTSETKRSTIATFWCVNAQQM